MTLAPLTPTAPGAPGSTGAGAGGAAADGADAFAALLASPAGSGTSPSSPGARRPASREVSDRAASPTHPSSATRESAGRRSAAVTGTDDPDAPDAGEEPTPRADADPARATSSVSADALAVLSAAQVVAATRFLPVSPLLAGAIRLEVQQASAGPGGTADGAAAAATAGLPFAGVPGAAPTGLVGLPLGTVGAGVPSMSGAGIGLAGAPVDATLAATVGADAAAVQANAPATMPVPAGQAATNAAPAAGAATVGEPTPEQTSATATGVGSQEGPQPGAVTADQPLTAPPAPADPAATTPEQAVADAAAGGVPADGSAPTADTATTSAPTGEPAANDLGASLDAAALHDSAAHQGSTSGQHDQNSGQQQAPAGLGIDGLSGLASTAAATAATAAATASSSVLTMPTAVGAAAEQLASYGVTGQVFGEVERLVSRGDGTQRITLNLQPALLGEVRVVLTVRAGEVHVRMAGGELAQQALLQGAPELHRLLDSIGATSSRIVVGDSGTSLSQNLAANAQDGRSAADQYTGGSAGRFGDQAGQPHHSHRGAGTRLGDTSARDGSAVGRVHPHLSPDPGTRTLTGVDVTM